MTTFTTPLRTVDESGAELWNSESTVSGIVNVKAHGATGDGTTDDTVAINASIAAASEVIFVPEGTYATTITDGTISKRVMGDGQLKTGSNKRGRYLSYVTTAPASEGNHDSILTAFNGDLSKCQFPIEHRITGAATLGQPTTGYKYTPEAYAVYLNLFNSSGHNHSTSSNVGRTAACGLKVNVSQYGQGDGVAFNASGFVSGAKVGATSFLANPAVVLYNGNVSPANSGVYLNPFELLLQDNGYDVAGVGAVINCDRDNATGALDTFWAGYVSQSIGAESIDAHFHGSGKARIGLNLVGTTFTSDKIAMALAANDRIYFNGTNALATKYPDGVEVSNDYITYNSDDSEIRVVVNNASALRVRQNISIVPKLNISSIPTSASGLASGDVWSDSGTLKIVA